MQRPGVGRLVQFLLGAAHGGRREVWPIRYGAGGEDVRSHSASARTTACLPPANRAGLTDPCALTNVARVIHGMVLA